MGVNARMRGVTAVCVSICNDKLLYDVLATNGCDEVKGGVVDEDRVDIKGKERIRGEFAKQIKCTGDGRMSGGT